MVVSGINMCMLFVTDMERSVDWYSRVLELTLVRRHDGFAVFETGNLPLALHLAERLEHPAPPVPYGRRGALIVFEVEDYPSAKALLESRGCRFGFENEQGGSVFGTFTDPDGNELQILQAGRQGAG